MYFCFSFCLLSVTLPDKVKIYIFIHLHVLNLDSQISVSAAVLYQAAELAEHTSKINMLEEAKRRKEEEADTWQLRVRANCSVQYAEIYFCHQNQRLYRGDLCVYILNLKVENKDLLQRKVN